MTASLPDRGTRSGGRGRAARGRPSGQGGRGWPAQPGDPARIETAYRAELDAAPDAAKKLAEIKERLTKLRSPFRSAEAFWIEEIIDPRETRSLL